LTPSLHTGATGRRLVFLCGLGPVLITAVLTIYQPTFLSRLDRAVYDSLTRSAPTRPPGGRVVIVDVDERSLSTVGQWPWRRDVVARLIARLQDLGASVIALDIIFAEPDRVARERQTTPDQALANTLSDGHVVLGYAMTFDSVAREEKNACVLHPLRLATFIAREDPGGQPYFRATNVVCSLPMLARSAASSGFLNAAPDSDGILRRVPLLIGLDGEVYPALAVSAVSALTGARDLALQLSNVNASSLIIDDRSVPLDGRGNLLLRYRGRKKTFSYVSAADVLSGRHI
jgi:adenylate cyclase